MAEAKLDGICKPPSSEQCFVVGQTVSAAGLVPTARSSLTAQDKRGSYLARWNIGRMSFIVDPGLYALGAPDSSSVVVVTANYKMSFDQLRAALAGRDCWILVLDTKGINVWCAAGKGTFGTVELYDRVVESRLAEVVTHRKIIIPQLGAPGVNGLDIKKYTGFQVVWGPVLAADLPAFLDNGMVADAAMRRKSFPLAERLALAPVEFVQASGKIFLLILFFLLLSGLGGKNIFWAAALEMGFFAVLALLAALIGGTVLVPVLLPWLSGRAFSVKGMWAGLLSYLVVVAIYLFVWPDRGMGRVEIVAWLLMVTAISSWLGMNFTGASTYTSRSGVRHEMLRAIPIQVAAGVTGFCCWLAARFWIS
ncbi:MAG: acetyl-CoA synthase subunit gamma [Proteobacteria bacterium]|nr:acetyl-CoA synthase subunit gamma [Pseudomonadota bacterium]MBU1640470.1 acetyl-CoA synthase subunit gamma [Pseudomonadota bacterium]